MTGVEPSPPVIVQKNGVVTYPIAEGVAAAAVGRDLVFLNLNSDQYSCLPNGAERLVGSSQCIDAGDLIETLIEAGLIRPSPRSARSANTPLRQPGRDVGLQAATRLRVYEGLDFLACWLEALARFRGRSIAALRKQVRGSRRVFPRPDDPRLLRRIAVFRLLLPWIPLPGACLFRSYMLLRFLQRGGCNAEWIIGVRTWPFEAHCWLQLEDVALEDRSERLVRFKPILAF